MSELKATPGPWDYLFRNGDEVYAVATRDRIAVVDLVMGAGNVDANAQLIAAAPELYDACLKTIEWMYSWGCVNGAISASEKADIESILEAALAKARGEA